MPDETPDIGPLVASHLWDKPRFPALFFALRLQRIVPMRR